MQKGGQELRTPGSFTLVEAAVPYCCDDSGAVPDAHVSYLAQRRERRGEWVVGVANGVLLLVC